ncbi:hypothetical protein ACTFIZ_011754 [Dictyostelium cf. discoideum]
MSQKDNKVFILLVGFNVAATSRNKQQLSNSVNNKFVTNDNFLALQVDLTLDESVKNLIINISSMAGFTGSFRFSICSSTKFALEGLTEGLNKDLKEFGIHASTKGSQSDPVKGCKVIIDHALSENPTTHLFLGPDSMKHAQSKIESIQNDIKLNYDKSSKTDFTN